MEPKSCSGQIRMSMADTSICWMVPPSTAVLRQIEQQVIQPPQLAADESHWQVASTMVPTAVWPAMACPMVTHGRQVLQILPV